MDITEIKHVRTRKNSKQTFANFCFFELETQTLQNPAAQQRCNKPNIKLYPFERLLSLLSLSW